MPIHFGGPVIRSSSGKVCRCTWVFASRTHPKASSREEWSSSAGRTLARSTELVPMIAGYLDR